jgi:putative ABC transport system substrate-binding protein
LTDSDTRRTIRDVARRVVLPGTIQLVVGLLGLFVAPHAIEAQQAQRVSRIGVLRGGASPDPLVEAFRQGLRDLGYVEGRNVSSEYRWAEGAAERLPALAADLLSREVDVIVAGGSDVMGAKLAASRIPIVMPVSIDPVRLGLVTSLRRPGGNITGLASLWDEMPGKWMEILREALPGVSRVAVLQAPGTATGQVEAAEAAARSTGVRLRVLNVVRPDDLQAAFAEAAKSQTEALIVLPSPFFFGYRTRIVQLAARHRIPVMYHQREYVVGAGGLMSYGPDLHDMFRRAAGYVDKILKGARPADLPIEQPTKFELVVNLKTAGILGLSIPPSVLSRADQVVR